MFKSLGINLQSFINTSETLEKGKKMPIGTITNGYKKVAEGKWQKVSSYGLTKKEHENKIKAGKDLANAYANENSESAYKKVKMGNEFAAEHEATLLHHDDLDDKEYDDDHVNNSGKKSEKDHKQGFSPEEAKKKVDGESKPQNSSELGKTKSGKTIYEDGSELEGDDDWDYTDHITAAAHHQSKMIDAKKNGDNQKFAEHGRYKLSHDDKANSKRNSLNKGIVNLSQEELIKSHILNQFEKGGPGSGRRFSKEQIQNKNVIAGKISGKAYGFGENGLVRIKGKHQDDKSGRISSHEVHINDITHIDDDETQHSNLKKSEESSWSKEYDSKNF